MIYNEIYNFCKVRNKGNCYKNGSEPTPRVKFIIALLEKEGIEYELDIFEEEKQEFRPRNNSKFRTLFKERMKKLDDVYDRYDSGKITKEEMRKELNKIYDEYDDKLDSVYEMYLQYDNDLEDGNEVNKYFNIIMKGTSNKMIIAHHDVNNHNIDNANDNSASVINVIATKKLNPSVHAVIVDGEEFGGKGSNQLGKQIKEGKFGNIEWVLNFELTGKGGKNFFIGDYPGKLSNLIIQKFNCPVVSTPFNDSIILRQHGIDSTVINPLPEKPKKPKKDFFGMRNEEKVIHNGVELDITYLYHCHSPKDTVATISTTDMKEFVEEVVLKILN